MRLFALFLSISLAMASSVLASDDACNRLAKGDLSGVLLKQTAALRSQLVRGYHLPMDYATGYYARRIEPYLAKPNYPTVEDPEVLYRGMFLSPSELESILANGMELKEVNWTAAGGGISFSSSANEAATYIFHAADNREGGIGVVFEVKKSDSMVLVDDPVLNSTRTIFKLH